MPSGWRCARSGSAQATPCSVRLIRSSASAATIVRVGARPVFVDIDPVTLNLDPDDAIRRADAFRGPETIRAVLSVDLFGRSCELGPLAAECRARDWWIVEDAAQSIDALDASGAKPGQNSDIACLSFYPTKNLGALGDAGGIVTSNRELAGRVARLRIHGEDTPGHYNELGINSRLDALQAVALSVKLRHLDSWTQRRRRLAQHYDAVFSEAGALPGDAPLDTGVLPVRTPVPGPATARHSYHCYVVRVPAKQRQSVIAALAEEGIASEIYYRHGLHEQPALEPYLDASNIAIAFPETERATRETLALPIYPELALEAVERIVGLRDTRPETLTTRAQYPRFWPRRV